MYGFTPASSGDRAAASALLRHQETRQRLVEQNGPRQIEDVAGPGKHREAGRRDGDCPETCGRMSQLRTELKPAPWSLSAKKGEPVSPTAKRCSEKIMFEQDDRAADEGLSTIHSVFLTEKRLPQRCML
jgi:hypothetical protein